MTQRMKIVFALLAAGTSLAGSAAAAPKPATPTASQEVITIQRTATHGLAALAIIGKIKADKIPGFFAVVDRTSQDALMQSAVDFNGATDVRRYGHGSSTPLCDAPLDCSLDLATNTLTFTFTETSDADTPGDSWSGLTRYLAIRGTHLDLQVAAIGFTVKRHATASFARVTREQADADGVSAAGVGAEVFQSAQLPGGRHGSFALLQLPCDGEGAGGVTFSATGDLLPTLVDCTPQAEDVSVGVVQVGAASAYGRQGVYSRSANGPTQWQVSGLATGVSSSLTRLFVLSY